MSLRRNDARMRASEVRLLEDLAVVQYQMDMFHQGDFDKDDFKKTCRKFDRVREEVKKPSPPLGGNLLFFLAEARHSSKHLFQYPSEQESS